jgi:hypothetical protein
MEEPERILDKTGSTLERALLLEGRGYSAPDSVRAHTLGLAGGLLAWLATKSLATKLMLALSTATLIAAMPVTYFLSTSRTPAPKTVRVPATVVAPAPASPVPAPPVMAAPAPAPTLPAPAPTRASTPGSSALRAELAALDAIRSTLANDDPTGALTFVEAYFRTFPRGRLRFEAEVMRIDALAKAGRTQAAKRHAREFIKQHPNSVLTARMRPYAEN